MGIDELKQELKELQTKRDEDRTIKNLKKQIRAEKFGQTRGGKVFNAIGDFGLRVGKVIATPPKQTGKLKKKKVRNMEEIMRSLPQ